ncbi:hypothetical protein QTJ16_000256 [Diplocarpon rosae]|uniref:Uncharacterized protein n=1 Tax=Diplocarpon rosae TaxID=946125 RepID=A0AAD9T4L6_9HELO|nr:hypothetical protein QTJ16_000256 [Diplocarpon rosae]
MPEHAECTPFTCFMHLLLTSHLLYAAPVVLFFSITIALEDSQGFARNVTNKLSLLLALVFVWTLALVGELIILYWVGALLLWSATWTLADQDAATQCLRSVEVLLLVLAVLFVFIGWLVTLGVGIEKIRELGGDLRGVGEDADIERQHDGGEGGDQLSMTWQSEWKSEWIDFRRG